MRTYLLGLNILKTGKHRPKTNLRADFSNGVHHGVEIAASESANGLAKALRELASKIDEDQRLGK